MTSTLTQTNSQERELLTLPVEGARSVELSQPWRGSFDISSPKGRAAETLVILREGDHLRILGDSGRELVLQGFFSTQHFGAHQLWVRGEGGSMLIRSDDRHKHNELDWLWPDPTTEQDDSLGWVLFAQGSEGELVQLLSQPAYDAIVWQVLPGGALRHWDTRPFADGSGLADGLAPHASFEAVGLFQATALGLIGFSGQSSSDRSDQSHQDLEEGSQSPESSTLPNRVIGEVAGPVLPTHGLKITLIAGDGETIL